MREILFRAKSICADSPEDTNHNYWVEGSLVHQTEFYDLPVNVYHIVKLGTFHCDYYDSEEVWSDTIGQFTGLLDKNCEKIFEGDIVKVRQDQNDGLGTIGYENGSFMVYPISGNIYKRTLFEYRYNDWDLECIGNKWDNPELLEVK